MDDLRFCTYTVLLFFSLFYLLPTNVHCLRVNYASLPLIMAVAFPRLISPHPINRQCFSTRRLSAIFSPSRVHTGAINAILAMSFFTPTTFPPVLVEPMFTSNVSFLDNFWTFAPFPPSTEVTPNSRRRRKKLISTSEKTSGKCPFNPNTCPTTTSTTTN